jgi:hypothetical protein
VRSGSQFGVHAQSLAHDRGDASLPSKLTDPTAKGGCRCRLQCGPVNDDGSKDCITICEGSGCDCQAAAKQ